MKIVLAILTLLIGFISCSNVWQGKKVPDTILNNFNKCYDGRNTGIERILNIDGYYKSKTLYKGVRYDSQKNPIYYDVSTDIIFYKDGIFGYNFNIPEDTNYQPASVYQGLYTFSSDTIKTQYLNKPSYMAPWEAWEVWYLVVSRSEIKEIRKFPIHEMSKSDWINFYDYGVDKMHDSYIFTSNSKIYNSESWLKKEKWFWCNEKDYQNFLDSLRLRK